MAKYHGNKRCVSWCGPWRDVARVRLFVFFYAYVCIHCTEGPRQSSFVSRGPSCPNSAGLTKSSGTSASRLRMPFIVEWPQWALALTYAKRKSDIRESDQERGRERQREKSEKSYILIRENGNVLLWIHLMVFMDDDVLSWWRGQGHDLFSLGFFFW